MTTGIAYVVDAAPVRAAFAALRVRIVAGLRAAWAQVGAEMVDAAVPYVPVATGARVDSLQVQADADGVEVTSGLIYEPVQDHGWPGHNIEGHHFSDRAAEGLTTVALELQIQAEIDAVGLR